MLSADRLFSIKIETNKNVYHVGEPIALRVFVTNDTGEQYGIDFVPPWALFKLVILQNGKPVSGPGLGAARIEWAPWLFKPGETQVDMYQDPVNPYTTREWADISHWRYTLTNPGYYTLVGYLVVRGYRKAANGIDTFVTSGKRPSNSAQITIVQ